MRKYVCLHFEKSLICNKARTRVQPRIGIERERDSVARTRVCCTQLHTKIRQARIHKKIIQFCLKSASSFPAACWFWFGNERKHCKWSSAVAIALALFVTYFNLYALNVESGIRASRSRWKWIEKCKHEHMYSVHTHTHKHT